MVNRAAAELSRTSVRFGIVTISIVRQSEMRGLLSPANNVSNFLFYSTLNLAWFEPGTGLEKTGISLKNRFVGSLKDSCHSFFMKNQFYPCSRANCSK